MNAIEAFAPWIVLVICTAIYIWNISEPRNREKLTEKDQVIIKAYNEWIASISRKESREVDDYDGFKAGYIFRDNTEQSK